MDAAGGRRPAAHTAPLQVVRKMGHRDRFGGDFGTGGAENGTPGEIGGFEGEAEGRGARSGGKMGPKSEAVD